MTAPADALRVLQVVAAPVPGREIGVNGPERRAASVVGRWSRFGIAPIVAYPRRGRLWERFADAGVPLVDFEVGGKLRWDRIAAIERLIRAHRARLVHTQGPASVDLLAGVAARRAGVPIVVTRPVMIEDHVHVSKLRRMAYACIDRFALGRAERVVAVSEAGRAHLEAVTKVRPERLEMVHNGVDLGRYHPRPTPAASRPTVGMVAQLTAVKGWHDFLAATQTIAAREPRLRALIVGAGPLSEELRDRVRQRGLQRTVEFCGQVEDVRPLLAEMDVFLFTSHREGLSMAVLEAMSSGVPVVATEVGGIREQVLEGVNGFVRDAGDVDGLARAASGLLADPQLRASFGAAARQWVERSFSEERMVQGYADVYHAAAAGECR